MGIYTGYSAFRRIEGWIELSYLGPKSRGIIRTHRGHPKIIVLNEDDSLDEQVRTLIHELLHLSPERRRFLDNLSFACQQSGKNHPEEIKIEEEMEAVYLSQPMLVSYLKNKILELRR